MKTRIFVPSHITGFFQIVEHENPLFTGSRGAGVVIDKGVITTVRSSRSDKIQVRVDGDYDPSNITFKVIELLREKSQIIEGLMIHYNFEVPMGCGFGASAACALGTVLGIARMLEIPITFNEAASIAHRAEVELKTGLGDVMGESVGGIVLRLKEGAPGYGLTDRIIHEPLYVVCKAFGELDTTMILKDPKKKRMINLIGSGMLPKLLKDPKPENFMRLSYEFAEKTKLLTSNVKESLEIVKEEVIGASMAMLGDTIFALSKHPDTSLSDPIIAKVDPKGARFLK
ncbi:MAG: pantoate kinase [Methanothermobacter sp.]|nr:pantoate kinase [Methanothermobacter sp.]